MRDEVAARHAGPIFHKCGNTIRGHVFCSFLPLLLREELQPRLLAKHWQSEWADMPSDLARLQKIHPRLQDGDYVMRMEAKGTAGKVFQACRTALPPTLRTAG